MYRTVTVTLLSIIFLNGCAPSSAGGVRELSTAKQITFFAPLNYQAAYRKTIEQMRKCGQIAMIGGGLQVNGDLYQDIKSGTITHSVVGFAGTDVHAVIDISESAENLSQITAFYSVGDPTRRANMLKKWILEDYKEC